MGQIVNVFRRGLQMNVQNLLNQFVGDGASSKGKGSALGGLAGGAAAGGVMALLVGNKKARKFAGKAVTYGGAAVLGGLAFNALKNWKQNNSQDQKSASALDHQQSAPGERERSSGMDSDFELKLVKTMISAANADGHIDHTEQKRIFKAMDDLQVDDSTRGMMMNLIRYPDSPESIAQDVKTMEQRSEIYLMACFVIDIDTPEERTYLTRLGRALELPDDLAKQLELQAEELALQAA